MTSSIYLSVVLPCLNEEDSLPFCLEEICATCQKWGYSYEIVVADNNSTDNSVNIARKWGARVIKVARRGYGATLHHGILAAKGKYIVCADADGSYPFFEIPRFVQVLANSADLVVGNRLRKLKDSRAMPFLNRYVGTPVLSALIRLLYHIPVYDCNGGMRGLKRAVYSQLPLECTGMEFASEMLVRAGQQGIKYQEIDISFRAALPKHMPHLRRWRDGWRHLRFILGAKFCKRA